MRPGLLLAKILARGVNQTRFHAQQMRRAEMAVAVRGRMNWPESMAAPELTVSNSRETINKVNNPVNEVQGTQDRMEIKGSNRVKLVRTVNRLPMKASNPGKAGSEARVRVSVEMASVALVVSNQTAMATLVSRPQPKANRMDKADKRGWDRLEIMDNQAIAGDASNWQVIIPVSEEEAVNAKVDRMVVAMVEIT